MRYGQKYLHSAVTKQVSETAGIPLPLGMGMDRRSSAERG
jgi:hypothetical protein